MTQTRCFKRETLVALVVNKCFCIPNTLAVGGLGYGSIHRPFFSHFFIPMQGTAATWNGPACMDGERLEQPLEMLFATLKIAQSGSLGIFLE